MRRLACVVVLALVASAAAAADFDLYLLDADGYPLDQSILAGTDSEYVSCIASIIDDNTDWEIRVTDFDGLGGSYTLRVYIDGVLDIEYNASVPDSYYVRVYNGELIEAELDSNEAPFELSTSSFTIVEGSVGTFDVRLAYAPSSAVSVTVAWDSGDSDISLVGGASLSFDATNWLTWQTVTLAAAIDGDVADGVAAIRVSATGYIDAVVNVTEADGATLGIEVDAALLWVPEGGQATVGARLVADPVNPVTVNVVCDSADSDLTIISGASLVFDDSDWSVWQTVTLGAADDADAAAGFASLRFSGLGLQDISITVVEADDDTLGIEASASFLWVPEDGPATVDVRLTADPVDPVTVDVARASGDSDIAVVLGATLVFDSADWSVWQTVTLGAADDADAVDGSASIRLSGTGLDESSVTVVEADDDTLAIETDVGLLWVPEDGTATVDVRLTADPVDPVTVDVARASGDPDIAVVLGATLVFDSSDWSVWQTVTLGAADDADAIDGVASIRFSGTGLDETSISVIEADDDMLEIEADAALVWVPEEGQATVRVRLAADPVAPVTVDVARAFGDSDLTIVLGASLVFDSSDWSEWQTVTLGAAGDADDTDGSATIRFSGTGLEQTSITVVEVDDDVISEDGSDGGGCATGNGPSGGALAVLLVVLPLSLLRRTQRQVLSR